MSKHFLFALLSLAASLALVDRSATAQAAPAAKAPAAQGKGPPPWVAKSNEYTQILIDAQAPLQPEQASFFGVPGFDDQVFDFGPGYPQRFRDAITKARAA